MLSSRHADLLESLNPKTYGIIGFVEGDKGVQIAFRPEVAQIVDGKWMGNYPEFVNQGMSDFMRDILAFNKFEIPQSSANNIYKNFPSYDLERGRKYAQGLVSGIAARLGFGDATMEVSNVDKSILFTFSKA
jgi:hypothetical protein